MTKNSKKKRFFLGIGCKVYATSERKSNGKWLGKSEIIHQNSDKVVVEVERRSLEESLADALAFAYVHIRDNFFKECELLKDIATEVEELRQLKLF